jgi:hypothetical protein
MYEQEDEDSLTLDFGMIQKFSQIKITAPITKADLEGTLKDLQELKTAFIEKGDEEREVGKQRFLKEQRRNRVYREGNDKYEEEEEKETSKYEKKLSETLNEKYKIVEQIG